MTQALVQIKDFLTRQESKIGEALPSTMRKYLTPERIVKIVMMAASAQPKIAECTQMSILQSIISIASVGLEPGGPLGHAYLVPFNTKNKATNQKEMTCTPIIGYRGLINLARRSGDVSTVVAHMVYEKDEFIVDLGSGEPPKHVPYLRGDRGDPYCVYCVAVFSDGSKSVDVMTLDEVDKIKALSKSGSKGSGPWIDNYPEMAKKTVVRRAAKYWPLSTELFSDGLALDDADYSTDVKLSNLVDVTPKSIAPPEQLPNVPKNLRPDQFQEFYDMLLSYADSKHHDTDGFVGYEATEVNINDLHEHLYNLERANGDVPM